MRLIDADALKTTYFYPMNTTNAPVLSLISLEAINDAPTIEAEPVRHGKWLHDDNFYYETRFVCSECKESECVPTIGFAPQKPLWDYCPNCGAKMD